MQRCAAQCRSTLLVEIPCNWSEEEKKIHIHAWRWSHCVRASKYLKSFELCAWAPREGKLNYVNRLSTSNPECVCLVQRAGPGSAPTKTFYGCCTVGGSNSRIRQFTSGPLKLIWNLSLLCSLTEEKLPESRLNKIGITVWRSYHCSIITLRKYIIYERYGLINLWKILKAKLHSFSHRLRRVLQIFPET